MTILDHFENRVRFLQKVKTKVVYNVILRILRHLHGIDFHTSSSNDAVVQFYHLLLAKSA